MKQIIFISLLCVCAISCIDLDTKSTAAIGSAQMWTTEDLADAGDAGIYKVFYPNSAVTTVPGKI